MPLKRRTAKRRSDPRAELEAWSSFFDCGTDFFNDLPALGIETDAYGNVEREVAEEAWHRLGASFLVGRDEQQRAAWAVEEFGEP